METGNNGSNILLLAKTFFFFHGWSSGHIKYNINEEICIYFYKNKSYIMEVLELEFSFHLFEEWFLCCFVVD